MDLSKLTPAPWLIKPDSCNGKDEAYCHWHDVGPLSFMGEHPTVNTEFVALARNAFDVMMRRGWHPYRVLDDKGEFIWCVAGSGYSNAWGTGADPFTALVEAEKWYRENVEK